MARMSFITGTCIRDVAKDRSQYANADPGSLAQVDAGKTSLTERLLLAAGVIDEIGSGVTLVRVTGVGGPLHAYRC